MMRPLTIEDLDERSDDFDRVVMATPDIDHFCSSSLWVLPAHEAIMGRPTPWLFEHEHGYVALAGGTTARGWRVLQPLESAWGLASPLLGSEPVPLSQEAGLMLKDPTAPWDLLLLSGIALQSPQFRLTATSLQEVAVVRLGPSTRRHLASLQGGRDGFMSRRSRGFRKNVRRAQRKANDAGILFESIEAQIESHEQCEVLYQRLLDVEARSWKGLAGTGIVEGDMRAFYRLMLARMAQSGAQRLIFARHDDTDIGYILGGVLAGTYRGLQFSYDQNYREASLGSLCQMAQIDRLCAEGVHTYDLGTDVEYKAHWAEQQFDTVTLIAHRR